MFLNIEQRNKYAATLVELSSRGPGTGEVTAVLKPRVEDAGMPVGQLTITDEELLLPLSWFELDVHERAEQLWAELEAVSKDYWWTLPQARMKFLNENYDAPLETLVEGYSKLDVQLLGAPRHAVDLYRQVALTMDFGTAMMHWLNFIKKGEVSSYGFVKPHLARTMSETLTTEEKAFNRNAWSVVTSHFVPEGTN